MYGGQFLRDRHTVKGGEAPYGGETIYYWDVESKLVNYLYINVLGGHMRGTVTPKEGVLYFPEEKYSDGKMEQMNQMPLGTGPFTFVAYQQDAVIRYKANPDYWGGKPKIDDLVFAITTDASVRRQKLEAGECHIFPYPNAADIDALKSNSNLAVQEQAGLNVAYLAYNSLVAPFDKP